MSDAATETLKEEVKQYEIEGRRGGFGSSSELIYDTGYTKIYAFAFHVPDADGKIKYFNLTLRRYQRVNFKTSFKLMSFYESSNGALTGNNNELKVDLNSKSSGSAVKNLAEFLNAQFKAIGQKLNSTQAIITAPEEIDLNRILDRATTELVEDINLQSRLRLLQGYKNFLEANLDKNEEFIQNWLDENNGQYRAQRCLIFGLEFIDHKREGELSRKRFDILTTVSKSSSEYVLVELKSPNANVFDIKEVANNNGGVSSEYHLSKDLARSIPQILRYRRLFESKIEGDDDLQRLGVRKGKVSKCVIVIGQKINDPTWKDYFYSLTESLSSNLEIWTYSYLVEKLDATILNLKESTLTESLR